MSARLQRVDQANVHPGNHISKLLAGTLINLQNGQNPLIHPLRKSAVKTTKLATQALAPALDKRCASSSRGSAGAVSPLREAVWKGLSIARNRSTLTKWPPSNIGPERLTSSNFASDSISSATIDHRLSSSIDTCTFRSVIS
jgi:hypothetical protein